MFKFVCEFNQISAMSATLILLLFEITKLNEITEFLIFII